MGLNDWTKRKQFASIANSHKFSTSPFSSISNISSATSSNTGIGKRTLRITLPEDFGAQVSVDGRIQRIQPHAPAHASSVVQVGDVVRVTGISPSCHHRTHSNLITLHVTYSQIRVDSRPKVPFLIEIGNRSHTALGMALTDQEEEVRGHSRSTWPRQIRIASIQRGSLADRCGFLRPGDMITSVHVKSGAEVETIPCSFYTSCQLAQLLRQMTSTAPSVTFSIVPCEPPTNSSVTLYRNKLTTGCAGSIEFKWEDEVPEDVRLSTCSLKAEGQRSPTEQDHLHSFCLWKDSSFDDWGFSIQDPEEEVDCQGSRGPTIVQEIRRGGPAFLVGLLPGDKIMQINERDVSAYESTILVPILASLQDALNLVILRN